MGYDTILVRDICDKEVKDMAISTGRILLTRDKHLSSRCERSLLIMSDDIKGQLREFLKAFPRKDHVFISRCPMCNGILKAGLISDLPGSIRSAVPSGVRENNRLFFLCLSCSKVYWEGTHWDNINAILVELDVKVALPKPVTAPEDKSTTAP